MDNKDLNKCVERLEFVPCNLCGNSDVEKMTVMCEEEKNGLHLNTVMCRNCGLIFINPRATKDLYEKFYNMCYRNNISKSDRSNEMRLQEQKKFYTSYISPIVAETMRNIRIESLLDIGCSHGGISLALREKYRVKKCVGVEPVTEIAKYAEKRLGIKVHINLFENIAFEEKYDLICLFRALNHTLDPKANLKKIHSLLNTNGCLLLVLYDGISNLIRKSFSQVAEFAHPYIFYEETIEAMLKIAGFRILSKRTNTLCGEDIAVADIPFLDFNSMVFLAQKQRIDDKQVVNKDVAPFLMRIDHNVKFYQKYKIFVDYWLSSYLSVRIRRILLSLKNRCINVFKR